MITCEYCNKNFTDKKCLTQHLKTNRKCNAIRNIETAIYKCADCNVHFSKQKYLSNHIKICITREKNNMQKQLTELDKNYNNEIIKMSEEYEWKLIVKDEKIKEQEEKLAEKDDRIFEQKMEIKNLHEELKLALKRAPTIINDNRKYINKKTVNQYMIENSDPISDILIRRCVTNLSIEHLLDFGKGLARCTLDVIGPQTIITTDVSRKRHQYVVLAGMERKKAIHLDIALHEFVPKIMNAFQEKSVKLIDQYITDNFDKNNFAFFEKLSDIKNNMILEANGTCTDLRNEYISEISKHTHKNNVIPIQYFDE